MMMMMSSAFFSYFFEKKVSQISSKKDRHFSRLSSLLHPDSELIIITGRCQLIDLFFFLSFLFPSTSCSSLGVVCLLFLEVLSPRNPFSSDTKSLQILQNTFHPLSHTHKEWVILQDWEEGQRWLPYVFPIFEKRIECWYTFPCLWWENKRTRKPRSLKHHGVMRMAKRIFVFLGFKHDSLYLSSVHDTLRLFFSLSKNDGMTEITEGTK